ncbi:hypothetical protein Nepgr_006636 [Nepenthes gracilis]|uniref:Uncharacterized protein n=1 Tax=Nepenthes gracilis TaxID=150966 RepID=A0AAD3S5L0_NEPGR|nr:hypothetical protein Nepgr_006636 [Nepenthes gracilis]
MTNQPIQILCYLSIHFSYSSTASSASRKSLDQCNKQFLNANQGAESTTQLAALSIADFQPRQVHRHPTRRHCRSNTDICNTQNSLTQTRPWANAVQPMHTSAKQHHALATSLFCTNWPVGSAGQKTTRVSTLASQRLDWAVELSFDCCRVLLDGVEVCGLMRSWPESSIFAALHSGMFFIDDPTTELGASAVADWRIVVVLRLLSGYCSDSLVGKALENGGGSGLNGMGYAGVPSWLFHLEDLLGASSLLLLVGFLVVVRC